MDKTIKQTKISDLIACAQDQSVLHYIYVNIYVLSTHLSSSNASPGRQSDAGPTHRDNY